MVDKAVYAGFWKRLGALLIDGLVLSPVSLLLGFLLLRSNYSLVTSYMNLLQDPDPAQLTYFFLSFFSRMILSNVILIIVSWFYFAMMESSKKQATVGKLALGIIVTDLQGERISVGRATGRYFAKMINSFILDIGYLMAAFTGKKQGLHDIIAGTLVLNKEMAGAFFMTGAPRPYRQPSYQPQNYTPLNTTAQRNAPQRANLLTDTRHASVDVICPKCQMVNSSNAIFCACCGDELKQNTAGNGKY